MKEKIKNFLNKAKNSIIDSDTDEENLFDNIIDPILIIDKDFNIIDVNNTFLEFIGKDKDEVFGKKCYSLIHGTDKPIENCSSCKSFETKKREDFELYHPGLKKHLLISSSPILRNGSVSKIVHHIRDTSDIKESEKRFRSVLNNSHDIISIVDKNAKTLWANKAWKKIFGENLDVDNPFEKIHPDNIDNKSWKEFIDDNKEIKNLEYRFRDLDGNYMVFETSAVKIDNLIYIFAHDITERKKAEEELKESEERFRQFFESNAEYCYVVSLTGKIVDINQSALNVLGYKKEEIIGQPLITTIYSPSSQEKAKKLFEKWKKEGKLRNEEMNIITKNGEERTIHLNVDSVKDKNGNIIHSTSVQTDITERKKADRALKKSEEKFRHLAETIKCGITIYRGDRVLYNNPVAYKLSGYNEGEIKNMKLQDFIRDDYKELIKKRGFERQKGKKMPEAYELPIVTKDGKEKWISVSIEKTTFDGEPAIIAALIDVTERKKAEEALKESEEKFRLLVENSVDVIMLTKSDTTIVYLSPVCEKVLGWKPEELVGTKRSIVYEKDWPRIKADLYNAIKGKARNTEYRIITREKKMKWISHSWAPIIEDKKVKLIVSVIKDITERKKTEEALKESEEKLRKRNQELEKFAKLSVGREEKMMELKKRIKELENEK